MTKQQTNELERPLMIPPRKDPPKAPEPSSPQAEGKKKAENRPSAPRGLKIAVRRALRIIALKPREESSQEGKAPEDSGAFPLPS